jgi:uncharacterized membrane protein YcjF (UPF0283 family)
MSDRMYMARPRTTGEEMALRERIRFLLPPVVAIGLMVALAFMAADARSISTSHEWIGMVFCAAMEAALLANVIARRRLQVRLLRLLADRCAGCGYSLTGNTTGVCPECGKPTNAAVKT